MSKIILTEKQLERVITLSLKEEISGRKSVKEQNLLNIPTASNASNAVKKPMSPIDAANAKLMKPGETSADYFKNPDGSIKTTDLADVTVSASRIKPNTPPFPKVNVPKPPLPNVTPQSTPQQPNPSSQTASVGSGPTAPSPSVDSGPTSPKSMSPGQEVHNMLLGKGLINSFADMNGYENRRLVYKGAPLSQEQVTQLTNYFVTKGYGKRFSQVADKRYGQKYVWVKGGGTPSDTDMAS